MASRTKLVTELGQADLWQEVKDPATWEAPNTGGGQVPATFSTLWGDLTLPDLEIPRTRDGAGQAVAACPKR